MKRYDTDDELERALFALPLEEPPADLRASILAATVYRAPAPFKAWEIWMLGGIVALAVWLVGLIVAGGADRAMETVSMIGGYVAAFFTQPLNLVWLTVGGATALWMSQLNLTPLSLRQQSKKR
ncbi:MAG: hypothetical protein JO165_13485 [Candidatus Eremiobacteraeota bacterium]|nr:hypothetical protein [Candidatus Eremiobacteraeota bacterium]